MKMNQVLVEVIEETTASSLQSATNTFLQSIGEATLVSIQLAVASGPIYTHTIVYAR